MIRLIGILALLAAVLPGVAPAETLVSTLSDDAVSITSNFTGERIVVFGAVRGGLEDDAGYEVAVVVEGPAQDVIVRQKERLLGIWANRTSREFPAVPSYYVMHLSENFGDAVTPEQLREFRLGLQSLSFVQEATAETTAERLAEALINLKEQQALYTERDADVHFLAPNVFRTTFFLPSDIPTGDYRVSVYLFRDEALLAGQTQILSIAKGGFSQRIARAAIVYPLYYGLACVVLAIFTGWLAGLIFRRN
jgi:uncharacterized protein (TIGR02186 family)